MKKLIITICLALFTIGASAQKGEKNIGAHVLYGTGIEQFGFGAKFQYNVTDAIRLEAVGDYFPESEDWSMFDINLNGHYLFHFANKFTAYPLVGINYTRVTIDASDLNDGVIFDDLGKESGGSLGFNIGGGIQYNLTDKLRIGAELKYQTISGWNTPMIGVGLTYTL